MADGLSTLSTESLTAAVTSLLQKPLPDINVHVKTPQAGIARPTLEPQQTFVQTLTTTSMVTSTPATAINRSQGNVPTLSYLLNKPTCVATTNVTQPSTNAVQTLKTSIAQTLPADLIPTTLIPSLSSTVVPALSLSKANIPTAAAKTLLTNGTPSTPPFPSTVIRTHATDVVPTLPLPPTIPTNMIPPALLQATSTDSFSAAKKLKFSVDNLHLSSSNPETFTSQSPVLDVNNSLSALQSLSTLQNILNSFSPVNVTNSINNITPDNIRNGPISIPHIIQNLPTQQLQQLVQALSQQTETNIQPAPTNNTFQPISLPIHNNSVHTPVHNQIHISSLPVSNEHNPSSLRPVLQGLQTLSESPIQQVSSLPTILENQQGTEQIQPAQSIEEIQNLLKGSSIQQYPFIVHPSPDGGPVQLIPIGQSLDLSWLQILQKNSNPTSTAAESKNFEGKGDNAPVAIQPKPPVVIDGMSMVQKDVAQSTLSALEQVTRTSDEPALIPSSISNREDTQAAFNTEKTLTDLRANGDIVIQHTDSLGIARDIQIPGEPVENGNAYELETTVTLEECPEDIEDHPADRTYEEVAETETPDTTTQPEPQKLNIFCTVCNKLYVDGCKVHNTEYEYIQDTPILTRARASLPACFQLQQTSTSSFKDYPGVWCKADLSERTVFGPAVGVKEMIPIQDYKQQTHGFNPYKLRDNEGSCEVLCLEKEEESNWMMFVRCAHSLMEQNCVLYQDNSAFCLITTTEVKAEEELLMWYSADLCEKLGISQNPENTKLFQCNHCGKYFTTKKLLPRHSKIVHPESFSQERSCPMCYKKFSSNSRLNNHMILHMGLKPYSCSVCTKLFSDSSNLKTHMLIHTGQKKYKCETCDKTFRQKAHLDVHYIVHTGAKKYKCSYCDKPFARQADLKIHTYTHTNELFYKCTTCGKVFYKTQNYKRHLKTHTGERNYMCNKCFKGFQTKYHRDRHLKICKEKNGKESSYMSLEEVAKLGNTYEIPLKNVTLRRDGNAVETVKPENGSEDS